MHALTQRIVPTLSALVAGFGLTAIASCTSAAQTKALNVGTTVLDAGSAVCQVLEGVAGMPDWVKISCPFVDKADGISKVFVATIPKSQARAMGMAIPCGSSAVGIAPLPAALASSSAPK